MWLVNLGKGGVIFWKTQLSNRSKYIQLWESGYWMLFFFLIFISFSIRTTMIATWGLLLIVSCKHIDVYLWYVSYKYHGIMVFIMWILNLSQACSYCREGDSEFINYSLLNLFHNGTFRIDRFFCKIFPCWLANLFGNMSHPASIYLLKVNN